MRTLSSASLTRMDCVTGELLLQGRNVFTAPCWWITSDSTSESGFGLQIRTTFRCFFAFLLDSQVSFWLLIIARCASGRKDHDVWRSSTPSSDLSIGGSNEKIIGFYLLCKRVVGLHALFWVQEPSSTSAFEPEQPAGTEVFIQAMCFPHNTSS